jgi:hypothetical protein
MPEAILPGTYIEVRAEGLISPGRVVTGNIGIVGTASKGPVNEVKILGSFSEAKEIFGDSSTNSTVTLSRALEQIYNNGGRTVYAVRTAGQSAEKAAYQTQDASTNLVKLEAKTPGTWGNEIAIKVSAVHEPSFVTEELKGNVTNLKRSHVSENGLNRITVKQKSTDLTRRYDIVYDKDPDNAKLQVGINKTTGALTFSTQDSAPGDDDTIIATYAVPADNSKKVELSYQTVKETYIIADAAHLQEQVNNTSKLVSASGSNDELFNKLPKDTDTKGERFGTGLHGNTAGADGEKTSADDYKTSLDKLQNEIINIVVLAGQDASDENIVTNLIGHLNTTANNKRERIAVIGSSSNDVDGIVSQIGNYDHERLIFTAPSIRASAPETPPRDYTASAVAGLIASLPVQASLTNKTLTIPGLSVEFTASELEKLVSNRVLAIEKRDGFRVVKGITTSTNSAWHQITTRRIVDYAIYGVRSACDPYIGKLNNERVRGAMKATLNAFLTRMVESESLVGYKLDVSATRAQEIAGEVSVTMTLQPTFSIDFIQVTMYLS